MQNILGISCFYHDSAAALVAGGHVVAAAHEERFSRIKQDAEFPGHAVDFCLRTAGISVSELDWVAFYERPFQKFGRILDSCVNDWPRSRGFFCDSMATWLRQKIWIRDIILDHIPVPKEKLLFIPHHLSHASSAFLGSPFSEAAVLTCDGVGEKTTTAFGVASSKQTHSGGLEHNVDLLCELCYPHSLGLFYSTYTALLGFRVNEGEYKMMGLSAYGTPRYVDRVYQTISVNDGHSIELPEEYYAFHSGKGVPFSRKFIDLWGEPRGRDGWAASDDTNLSAEDTYWADIAASVQQVTEEILVGLAHEVHRRTNQKNLCLAGGVALNSLANARILKDGPFDAIYVQPAAGDAGGALGAALYASCVLNGEPRPAAGQVYLGSPCPSTDSLVEMLEQQGYVFDVFGSDAELCGAAAQMLASGSVIGWFQGRSEWGPRALGNRSILANPCLAEMKNVVNARVKHRELFRPFAPVVIEEEAGTYFDLPAKDATYPLRNMLLVVPVQNDKIDTIPAVAHVDGSARCQLLPEQTNPILSGLLRAFGDTTGVPVLLNTSFNGKGEPIVDTPADALAFFDSSDIEALCIGRCIVKKGCASK